MKKDRITLWLADPQLSGIYLQFYTGTMEMEYSIGEFTKSYNMRLKVTMNCKHNKEELDAYFMEMKKLASELKRDSDFESVKMVHDYLIDNYEYDNGYEKLYRL